MHSVICLLKCSMTFHLRVEQFSPLNPKWHWHTAMPPCREHKPWPQGFGSHGLAEAAKDIFILIKNVKKYVVVHQLNNIKITVFAQLLPSVTEGSSIAFGVCSKAEGEVMSIEVVGGVLFSGDWSITSNASVMALSCLCLSGRRSTVSLTLQ